MRCNLGVVCHILFMGNWKLQDCKMTDNIAGVEIAGLENGGLENDGLEMIQ